MTFTVFCRNLISPTEEYEVPFLLTISIDPQVLFAYNISPMHRLMCENTFHTYKSQGIDYAMCVYGGTRVQLREKLHYVFSEKYQFLDFLNHGYAKRLAH